MSIKRKAVRALAVGDVRPALGSYVMVCRWGDASPSDPYQVGYVDEINDHGVCSVVMRLQGESRFFRYYIPLTPAQGAWIVENYPKFEGTDAGSERRVHLFEGDDPSGVVKEIELTCACDPCTYCEVRWKTLREKVAELSKAVGRVADLESEKDQSMLDQISYCFEKVAELNRAAMLLESWVEEGSD